jgi:hypothetical protein
MSRFLVTALGTAVLLGALSPLVLAGQPDPAWCIYDSIFGCSPKNMTGDIDGTLDQYEYRVQLRGTGGSPLIEDFPASQIEIDLTGCTLPTNRISDQIPADNDSNANGEVFWRINGTFGGVQTCGFRVLLQNTVVFTGLAHLGLPNSNRDGGVRSPDNFHQALAEPGGDGIVGLVDFSNWRIEFNLPPTGPRFDYVGDIFPQPYDGLCTISDLSCMRNHFNAN